MSALKKKTQFKRVATVAKQSAGAKTKRENARRSYLDDSTPHRIKDHPINELFYTSLCLAARGASHTTHFHGSTNANTPVASIARKPMTLGLKNNQ